MMGGALTDLLLISDLHLGSHLKPRMRGEFVHLASKIEDTFPHFIDHYLRRGDRWQLGHSYPETNCDARRLGLALPLEPGQGDGLAD